MPLHNILNQVPSSTQPECHHQDLKEGSIGERSQGMKSPSNLVVMHVGFTVGVGRVHGTCPISGSVQEQVGQAWNILV